MFYFVVLLLGFGTPGQTQNLDSKVIEMLTHARSSNAVEQTMNSFEDLQIARAACKLQLREGSIPFACYQTYHQERQLGFRSPSDADLIRNLDMRCRQAAFRLNVASVPMKWLSRNCRQRIHAAKAIQEYRQSKPGPSFELN